MTLSFSTKWPAKMGDLAGKPNYFIEKIWNGFPCNELSFKDFDYYASRDEYFDRFHKYWDGEDEICFSPKIHTIRSGNRWKAGMKIHPVINSRTKDIFQFAPVLEVKRVQDVRVVWYNGRCFIYIDGKFMLHEEMIMLAINDGFPSVEAFYKWFDHDGVYQLIHWTDLKY